MAFCVFIATVLSSSVVVMTCRDPTAVFEKRGGEPLCFFGGIETDALATCSSTSEADILVNL